VSEVPAAAEEAGEEVEGVVLLAGAAALLVLLDAIVAVLVVYLAGLLLAEDFVGFGYFDELLTCSFVAAESKLADVPEGVGGILNERTGSCLDGTFC
jgi:hypothetical protein